MGAGIGMEFQRIWILRGANIWARYPVLEVELDLTDLAAVTDARLAACAAHLHAWLPSLAGQPIGVDLPAILRDVTLELQRLAGSPVKVGLVRPAGHHPDTPLQGPATACASAYRRLRLRRYRLSLAQRCGKGHHRQPLQWLPLLPQCAVQPTRAQRTSSTPAWGTDGRPALLRRCHHVR
jgi:hypothetical protein